MASAAWDVSQHDCICRGQLPLANCCAIDLNQDRILDAKEVEAVFYKEALKLHME